MKISKWGLDTVLATNLSGLPIFESLLSKVNMETDEDGNLVPYQVDNVKTFIKVAFRLSVAKGDSRSSKLRQSLVSLLGYGTEESSDNIRRFLESPESREPLVVTELSVDDGNYTKIAHMVSSLVDYKDVQVGTRTLDDANMLIRNMFQEFSN